LRTSYLYVLALAVGGADQASKLIVTTRLPFGSSAPLFGGPIYIAPVRNPGGAFGLLESWAGLLMVVTVAVVVAIIFLIRRGVPLHPLVGTALALQLGGALGNLIDRVRFGYVLDFIDLRVWPVFNIADSAITIGFFLLLGYLIFCDKAVSKAKTESSRPGSGTTKE